jgi:hypothetical protein
VGRRCAGDVAGVGRPRRSSGLLGHAGELVVRASSPTRTWSPSHSRASASRGVSFDMTVGCLDRPRISVSSRCPSPPSPSMLAPQASCTSSLSSPLSAGTPGVLARLECWRELPTLLPSSRRVALLRCGDDSSPPVVEIWRPGDRAASSFASSRAGQPCPLSHRPSSPPYSSPSSPHRPRLCRRRSRPWLPAPSHSRFGEEPGTSEFAGSTPGHGQWRVLYRVPMQGVHDVRPGKFNSLGCYAVSRCSQPKNVFGAAPLRRQYEAEAAPEEPPKQIK